MMMIPDSDIPEIPTLAGTDAVYCITRGRLYKITIDEILSYIESNGDLGGPGSGTANRVAYWATASTLGDFPLELNVSNVRFTQSTGVRLPRGATSFEPTASQGFIRFDTTIDEFTAVRDTSEGHEVVRVGGVERFNVSSTSTVSPVKDLLVVSTGSSTYTITIGDTDLDDGTAMDILNRNSSSVTLDSSSYVFEEASGSSSTTVSIPANSSARLILQAGISGRWYVMKH